MKYSHLTDLLCCVQMRLQIKMCCQSELLHVRTLLHNSNENQQHHFTDESIHFLSVIS